MNLIAYVRAAPAEALADPVAFQDSGSSVQAQRRRIERWARARRHRIVDIVRETSAPAAVGIETRVGLGRALEMLRRGGADGLVVADLDRLDPDVLIQEEVFGEIRRLGARLMSAHQPDEQLLDDPPADPLRMEIRRAVAAVPRFQSDLRALRARMRILRVQGADEAPALVELENLGARGIQLGELGRALARRDSETRRARRFGDLIARARRWRARAEGDEP